jgi:hypothetical protein
LKYDTKTIIADVTSIQVTRLNSGGSYARANNRVRVRRQWKIINTLLSKHHFCNTNKNDKDRKLREGRKVQREGHERSNQTVEFVR